MMDNVRFFENKELGYQVRAKIDKASLRVYGTF